MNLTCCPQCGYDLREAGVSLRLDENQRRLVYSAAYWLRRAAKASAHGQAITGLETEKLRAWECTERAFLPATMNAALRRLLDSDALEAAQARELAEALIWAAAS